MINNNKLIEYLDKEIKNLEEMIKKAKEKTELLSSNSFGKMNVFKLR